MRNRAVLVRAAVAATAAVAVYSFLIEPVWVQLRRQLIHIRDLPSDLEGLRIGLLTDLHAGPGRSLALVRKACRLVMGEYPALIAITGDLASRRASSFEAVLDALRPLHAPLGIYGVPGNHDHLKGFALWARELREHSEIVDLTNRSVVVQVGRARLCIAGVDDYACGDPSLNSLPPPGERDVTILLAHNPDQAESARSAYDKIDLVLSGHTHGGQLRLPWVGPLLSSVDNDDLYEEGLRRRPWTQVYTSRGLGTVHIPARLLTRPEVTVLQLTGTPREMWRVRGKPMDSRGSSLARNTE